MAASKTPIYFGNFLVTPQVKHAQMHCVQCCHSNLQVFHLTPHSFALVNLKPLLPGHVLVSPRRRAARLSDLDQAELADLFTTVQRVGRVIERVYQASSLNIAIQDGPDAGQSVPHVHTHIIPRKRLDLDSKGGSDAIYGMLDGDDGNVGRHQYDWVRQRPRFPTADNETRSARSETDMAQEASMLAEEMEACGGEPSEKL